MLFGNKKVSVIDRRIKELQKEMERVQGEMKTAAKPRTLQPSKPAARVSTAAGAGFPALGRPENDLFARAAGPAEAKPSNAAGGAFTGGSDQPSLFDQPDTNPQSVRKKFANYFMAGHFQNLRPLRQENRIIRNKAIVMMILVLVLIFWLVYYLKTH